MNRFLLRRSTLYKISNAFWDTERFANHAIKRIFTQILGRRHPLLTELVTYGTFADFDFANLTK